MPSIDPLPPSFYARGVLTVAPDLLGRRLVRLVAGQRLAGIITETEAYNGEADLACHARSGRTARNAPMYGPPGHAYIYFTYGLHWMLNVVTQAEGEPTAVLIRAIHSTEGLDQIAAHRAGRAPQQWADGPAKLCQALAIDASLNTADLTTPAAGLWIEAGQPIPIAQIQTSPRIGIAYSGEPWAGLPWRFYTLKDQFHEPST